MSRKQKKKVLYCKLCGFIARDEDELEFHYQMNHEPDIFDTDDLISEDDVW